MLRWIHFLFAVLGIAWCINWFFVYAEPEQRLDIRIWELVTAAGVTAAAAFCSWLFKRG